MAGQIKASFVFNDKTYHGAYAEHLKHRRNLLMRLRALMCVVFIVVGAVMIIKSDNRTNKTLFALGAISVSAGSIGYFRPMIWQMWHERNARKNPAYKSKVHYIFSDEMLTVDGKQGRFDIAWEDVYELVGTKKGVLVYTNKKSYLWIPKVAFKDDEMQEAVDRFAISKK